MADERLAQSEQSAGRSSDPPGGHRERPWEIAHKKDRVAPRECIRAARDALDRAYGRTCADPLLYPFLIEALDWLRRGLEQIADEDGPPVSHGDDGAELRNHIRKLKQGG